MKRTGEDRYQPGRLAYSLKGRDAGRVYVIIRREEQFVFVADGTKRSLTCPKRKNIRHLQLTNRYIDPENADDSIIIQAIEEYLNRANKQED